MARPPRVAWRGLLIGLALVPFNALWIITIERVEFGPYPTSLSLFANAILWLFLLNAANALLRRLRPRWALSQGDLLTAYVILAVASGLAGMDQLQVLVQMIPHVTWFGNASNNYPSLFGHALPPWLTIADREAVEGYYLGSSTLYRPGHIAAWAMPVAAWTLFIVLLLTAAMCLNSLLRRQWADHERLSFPLVWLPVEMSDPSQRLWRSGLLWAGFAVSGGLDLLNGLSFLYPSLPSLSTNPFDLLPFITQKPWNAVGWTPITFYPIIIAIGYLLPLDLLFSCWFFYLFWKAQLVVSSAMAWDAVPEFPYIKHQGFGAFVAVMVFSLWGARRYLKLVWRHIRGRPSEITDAGEALSYRAAAVGFALSSVGLVLFSQLAGLSWWWGVSFFALYLMLILVVTRIRAEFGSPVHDIHFSGPEQMLTDMLGPQAFSRTDLTVFGLFFWFNRAHRSDPMPHGLEALKMADNQRASRPAMFWAVMLAVLFGTMAAFWASLHLAYDLGTSAKWNGRSWFAQAAYDRLAAWIASPRPPNGGMGVAILTGFAGCAGLFAMRRQFLWWPFHPIGYAIAGNWSINLVWMPMLIAWTIKGLVLRYGRRDLYLRLLPFFYGLILGECVVGSLWSLVGMALHQRMYSFWGA